MSAVLEQFSIQDGWQAERTGDPRVRDIHPVEPTGWEESSWEKPRWGESYQPCRTIVDPPAWVSDAITADQDNRLTTAIDILFDNMDRLLMQGDMEPVDSILRAIPTDGPSLTFLMGVLSITLPASAELPSREPFFQDVWNVCVALGKNPDELLGGLRRWSTINGARGGG